MVDISDGQDGKAVPPNTRMLTMGGGGGSQGGVQWTASCSWNKFANV